MISPFFFSILPCISLMCSSNLDLPQALDQCLRQPPSAALNSHLLVDKLQPAVHSALGIGPVLFEQHRADELVNGLAILQLLKLL